MPLESLENAASQAEQGSLMSSESSTQRQSLTEIESTCAACGRTLESDSPRVRSCQKCLVAGYCNEECQARGSGMHEYECPSVALEGFKRNLERITGGEVLETRSTHVEAWTKRAEESVMQQGQLPHGLTATRITDGSDAKPFFSRCKPMQVISEGLRFADPNGQSKWLSDAFTQGRVVLDQGSDEATRERWFSLLFLWGLSLLSEMPGYGIKEKEIYLSIMEEVLSYCPPGSASWASREIIFTCVAGGFVLSHLGRVQESVILARRLTGLVEGSLHHMASRSSKIMILETLYEAYAHWTYDMARLQPSQARPDEADEVHERAIELAELSSAPAKELALLYHEAASIKERKCDSLEALKLLRRAIELPELPVSLYMQLARRAITHLRRLNRDTQALVLIADVLVKARRHPNVRSRPTLLPAAPMGRLPSRCLTSFSFVP